MYQAATCGTRGTAVGWKGGSLPANGTMHIKVSVFSFPKRGKQRCRCTSLIPSTVQQPQLYDLAHPGLWCTAMHMPYPCSSAQAQRHRQQVRGQHLPVYACAHLLLLGVVALICCSQRRRHLRQSRDGLRVDICGHGRIPVQFQQNPCDGPMLTCMHALITPAVRSGSGHACMC